MKNVRNVDEILSDRGVEYTGAIRPIVVEDFIHHIPRLDTPFEMGHEIGDMVLHD